MSEPLAERFKQACALGIPDDVGLNVFSDRYRAMEFVADNRDVLCDYVALGEAVAKKVMNEQIIEAVMSALAKATAYHKLYAEEDVGIMRAFAVSLLEEGGFTHPRKE